MNLDQMGPLSAKSYPGQQLVHAQTTAHYCEAHAAQPELPKAERAKQAIDYGRRGKGYIFGAFRPATGDALTRPYHGRTIANWVDFLEQVEEWLPAESDRVYAIVDNLSVHRATDVLLFCLAHPRWKEGVPTQVCRLAEPDRAVVENPRFTGLEGATVRDLG